MGCRGRGEQEVMGDDLQGKWGWGGVGGAGRGGTYMCRVTVIDLR